MDDPQNGMQLELGIHTSYVQFKFCFFPKVCCFFQLCLELSFPRRWDVRAHISSSGSTNLHFSNSLRGHKEVQFVDHATKAISVPDPNSFAIHAAVVHILHDTGTGEYLDALFNLVTNGTMEQKLAHVSLRISLTHILQI
jgi:hypothetical protein